MGSAVEDKREAASLSAIADRLLSHPELSFSSACGSGLRKAAWRIFSKPEVDVNYGHYQRTQQRCQGQPVVLVSQDTSDLSYPTHQASEGLGDLGGGKGSGNAGLCLHSAMAMSETGLPLGLLGQKVWAPVATGRALPNRKYALEEKESYRWVEALHWVNRYATKAGQVVVLSDRESDFYEYMIAPRAENVALLFRAHHLERKIVFNHHPLQLRQVAFANSVAIELYLPESKQRAARIANLQVSWGEVICPPAEGKKGAPLTLSVVIAKETDLSQKEPLEWYLLTTLPVGDGQAALLMIDYYRKRWVIERWHLVLKDGLKVERLQFNNFIRLSNAIQLLSVVAWQLLCLKHLAAQQPLLPLEQVFEPLQIQVLEAHTKTKNLSLKQALIAIAALAGFVASKKQPLPGEKTIWKGWAIFSSLCNGYQLAFQNTYGTG